MLPTILHEGQAYAPISHGRAGVQLHPCVYREPVCAVRRSDNAYEAVITEQHPTPELIGVKRVTVVHFHGLHFRLREWVEDANGNGVIGDPGDIRVGIINGVDSDRPMGETIPAAMFDSAAAIWANGG